jgi:hypothetical protein
MYRWVSTTDMVYSRQIELYLNEWFGQSDKNDELPDGTYY